MIDKNNKDLTAAQMLFEARTSGRRKREIFTISKILCIKEEYLSALETGEYDKIPERVYILGFARNYAIELGLDPDVVVGKIKEELSKLSDRDRDILKSRRLQEPAITLENLSVKYGISKERVRQIEDRVFNKIKKAVLEDS